MNNPNCPLYRRPLKQINAYDGDSLTPIIVYQCANAVQVTIPVTVPALHSYSFFRMGYPPVAGFTFNPHEAFGDSGLYNEMDLFIGVSLADTIHLPDQVAVSA